MKKTENIPGEAVSVRAQGLDGLDDVVHARHSDPFRVLGPHWVERDAKSSLTVRAFRPGATEASVVWVSSRATYPATQISPGVFEAVLPAGLPGLRAGEAVPPAAYRLHLRFVDGVEIETHDPYAFPPVLTDYDLYLSGEGTHYLKYEKLGAHVREIAGVRGVHFAVWAPNAQARERGGRFQFLGWPRERDAEPGIEWHLGNFHARA